VAYPNLAPKPTDPLLGPDPYGLGNAGLRPPGNYGSNDPDYRRPTAGITVQGDFVVNLSGTTPADFVPKLNRTVRTRVGTGRAVRGSNGPS
jgi:hypothetical protein